MRVTPEKAAENREQIVAAAAKLFSEKGFDAVGVDAVMGQLGLTHGGFYRYFRSKQELAAAAIAHRLAITAARQDRAQTWPDYVDAYLSEDHRDNPAEGCPIAALAADVARQGDKVRDELTADLPGALERLGERMPAGGPAPRRAQAIGALAGMVGALVLARAVNDPALSSEILATMRTALCQPDA